MNNPKRSSYFKDARNTKPWDMRDVVEHFSDKPFEEVVKEQKAKQKKR